MNLPWVSRLRYELEVKRLQDLLGREQERNAGLLDALRSLRSSELPLPEDTSRGYLPAEAELVETAREVVEEIPAAVRVEAEFVAHKVAPPVPEPFGPLHGVDLAAVDAVVEEDRKRTKGHKLRKRRGAREHKGGPWYICTDCQGSVRGAVALCPNCGARGEA